ncbi:MAG: GIY-YIG nuclease family protein [Bacteroidota bacterium]
MHPLFKRPRAHPYRTARSGGAHRTENMFYVYVLYSSKSDSSYVGMTQNLKRRLGEHNTGKTKSTQRNIPWVIVHQEVFDTRTAARKREKYLKSVAGRRWRKQNIRPRGATE